MSVTSTLGRYVSSAIRRPDIALIVLREQRLRVIVRIVDELPPSGRRALLRPLLAAASGLRRIGLDGSRAHVAEALALWGLGRREAAMNLIEAGSSPDDPRAAIRMAALAIAIDRPFVAARIVDRLASRPGGLPQDLATRALFGEALMRVGSFRAAVTTLSAVAAERPRDRRVRYFLERARGELRALTADWHPVLGPSSIAVTPTRGRVLHLLTNSLPYRQAGYTLRSQSIAQCQREIGLDPHMATRAGFPASEGVTRSRSIDEVDGVPYHRLRPDLTPGTRPDLVVEETARAACPLVERLRPAVLHPASNHLNARVALALRDGYGIPIVYEVRGFLEETWLSRMGESARVSERYALTREAETACMRAADAVVTLSETMRADILARGGIDQDKVVVIPNAVDVDRFVPGERDDALAARLGIGRRETVVGYISSFVAYEGIAYLIEALAHLRRRGRAVKGLLVGDGEHRADLEATARSLGLLADGTVVFTGRVPSAAVERYYRLIDIFVVPRTTDRVSQLVTPLKPYEAMAMERALVVSDLGALREIVIPGETGYTFRPEDPVDLAGVLERLVDDPAGRQRLGRAARDWVAAHRTWGQNGQRYRELYDRMGVA
jgi:PEP-CTERM/exosortase A-associated glycosyltransferase